MSKYPEEPPPYGFQQPQPQMQQPHMQAQHPHPGVATTMVVVGGTGGTPVGPASQMMTCPSCHHQISTRLESEAVTKTHLMAFLLCIFGCCLCACIPYCMDSCKNVNHYCPNCNSFLGTYHS